MRLSEWSAWGGISHRSQGPTRWVGLMEDIAADDAAGVQHRHGELVNSIGSPFSALRFEF